MCRRRVQSGSSLFEVMIAVLVLSTGMLGVAAMQSTSLRNSQSAFQRSQAVVLTYAISDAMRANVASARINAYNLTLPTTGCTVPSAGGSLASKDLNAWVASIQATMGGSACGGVVCALNVCQITVRWNDEAGTGGATSQSLRSRSRI
ncbi:MAG: type IV pilus modification protein PilV [Rhodanobacteraceae bacterium]|nr:type IV pilus modification protein PilV [Rhodanobacteraceae bacterium]MBL0027602.1 type IV pilus modification protein PilV [Rhodanobacteraceae bacterium]MBL0041095.1 type IV pilus modification protein PilV [Xanthomonadales bacterium]MBP9154991.1 type IV pilus modification protein PilV [Xanthomonadales bacterium]